MSHQRHASAAGALLLIATCGVAASCSRDRGINRPVVAETAAETARKSAAAGADSRNLDFFDVLETRRLVAHDDVLEGALILGTGQGGASFEDRARAALALGYVDPGYNPPAREAATIGEVSRILVRVASGGARGPVSVEEAMSEMIARGALPPGAKSFQGLTGAQLVSMLGAASDAMASAGIGRSPWPAAYAPAPSPHAPRPVGANPEPESSAGASAEDGTVQRIGFKGRPEPLPDVPPVDEPSNSAAPAPSPPPPKHPSSGDAEAPAADLAQPETHPAPASRVITIQLIDANSNPVQPSAEPVPVAPASAPIAETTVAPPSPPAVPAPALKSKPTSTWVQARPLRRAEAEKPSAPKP